MEIFRSVLGGVNSSNDSSKSMSSAETIERLVERLKSSTLLEDRRDACRALKAMSRKFRVEVGAQALDPLLGVLENDRHDEEIVGYSLETVANICSAETFEEEEQPASGVGEQFTEIFLKKQENVQHVVDSLQDYDFRVRRPAIRLLTSLLVNKPREMQEVILSSRMAVSRLMDILVDSREVLRNDALILLIQATRGNANLQKIMAFENAFDRLADIVELEGHSDGGIVVEDCLRLMLNLLRNNSSNQTFFREGSYIQRVAPFFDVVVVNGDGASDDQQLEAVGWSAQKVSNMLHMLQVLRTLVSPSNPTAVMTACQTTIRQCGLMGKLCDTLMASGIPANILTETINALAETVRGQADNQKVFAEVMAPLSPPKPAVMLLLMSMVTEKQPFGLRCASLYCFQCYLHKNPTSQREAFKTLLEESADDKEGDVTIGHLLCGGTFSRDPLSCWFSAVALLHGLLGRDDDLKKDLLRVQLSSTSTTSAPMPASLLRQCFSAQASSTSVQTRFGLLMLICTWVDGCPVAVSELLRTDGCIPFLTGQVGSNEHDEGERLVHGLCAFLLGLCLLGNDDSVAGATRDQLLRLVETRIGAEEFAGKLAEVSRHEAYNRALKQPQLRCADASELVFDYAFCQRFKVLEHAILSQLTVQKADANAAAAEVDSAIVVQYKDLIREQDSRINEVSRANLYLQQELSSSRQELGEVKATVQSLRDQNELLKALQQPGAAEAGGPAAAAANGSSVWEATRNDVERWKSAYETLKDEQDDLLIMLSEQDNKVQKYQQMLKDLGHTLQDTDSETEEEEA